MRMIQRLSVSLLAVVAVATFLVTPVLSSSVHAAPKDQLIAGAGTGNTGGGGDLTVYIKNIVNILLFVVGAVAVLMIVIGGLRYVTSGGDSTSVTSAKNTVLYAVVGLIVAAAAYAIVNFVVVGLFTTGNTSNNQNQNQAQ